MKSVKCKNCGEVFRTTRGYDECYECYDSKVIPSRWYDCGKLLTRRDASLGKLRSELMDTFDCHLELRFVMDAPRDDGLIGMSVEARRKIDGKISLESVEYYVRGMTCMWVKNDSETRLDE